jgi:hypothetical protein
MQTDIENLYSEYASNLENIGVKSHESDLVAALFEQCDWSQSGAEVVVMLARQYGTFVLRNALALAAVLEIEDGSAGL